MQAVRSVTSGGKFYQLTPDKENTAKALIQEWFMVYGTSPKVHWDLGRLWEIQPHLAWAAANPTCWEEIACVSQGALLCVEHNTTLYDWLFPILFDVWMETWQLIDWLVKLEETQGQSSQITDTDVGREPHINEQRTTERLVKKSEAPKKRQDRQSKTKSSPNEAKLV